MESFGLDECWLDVTGSAGLFGSGEQIADKLRARIRRELGITASVGVSFNKVFAKLGSDYKSRTPPPCSPGELPGSPVAPARLPPFCMWAPPRKAAEEICHPHHRGTGRDGAGCFPPCWGRPVKCSGPLPTAWTSPPVTRSGLQPAVKAFIGSTTCPGSAARAGFKSSLSTFSANLWQNACGNRICSVPPYRWASATTICFLSNARKSWTLPVQFQRVV